jgi:hypothetical protein
MKKYDLQKILRNENVPQDSYYLDGGYPNEAYCLGFNEDVWEVYYSERGKKTSLKTFADEEDACNYFYNWLINGLKQDGRYMT